jgi:hypothetical protein
MPLMIAALPASTSYQLNSYGFGGGGTAGSSSTNYQINGSAGEVAGSGSSTNYRAGSGENYLKQANVPTITLVNATGIYYNKLLLTIGPQNNPSDALFAVAISTDNFATVTKYIKSDFTIGNSLTFSDYQTYAAWGSGSGQIIRGLVPNGTYTVKAKAYRGKFTESAYGPTATASTTTPSISFDIDVSAIDISTSPPYAISFGSLPVSTVTDSPTKVWVSLDTNAESGGTVYLNALNGGLVSNASNYTIPSVTGDLSVLPEGYGVQGSTATQSSGGPFTLTTPYDGTAQNVALADNSLRQIFSAPAPVSAGRGSFLLKAKTKPLTPASPDYTETLTCTASASF